MTPLTLVVLLLLAVTLPRNNVLLALALAGVAPAGAALVAGVAVSPFYTVAMILPAAIVIRLRALGWRPRHIPQLYGAEVALMAFAVWAIVISLVAPIVSAGLVIDSFYGVTVMQPGVLSTSTLAQMIYLVLSVLVVVYLRMAERTGPWILVVLTSVSVALSFWAFLNYTLGIPFPKGFFDNNPTIVFQERLPTGEPRFRGILSEPAGLSFVCLAGATLAAAYLARCHGWRRAALLFQIAVCVVMGVASTSTTFLIVGAALVGIAVTVLVVRSISGADEVSFTGAFVSLAVIAAAVPVVPTVWRFITTQVTTKLNSGSATERGGNDSYALELFAQSHGLGLGLGVFRPSSFIASMLATTGLIGLLLLMVGLGLLLSWAFRSPEAQPVAWLLLAVLLVRAVSSPDLNDPSGLFYLSIGTLLAMRARADREAPSAVTAPSTDVSSIERSRPL